MDCIAVRDLGDCAGDCADWFASESGRCEEKGGQSRKQAEEEKAFYGECFYGHSVTIVIYRIGRIEDRVNPGGCQRKWIGDQGLG